MKKRREARTEAALESLSWWFRDNWQTLLALLVIFAFMLALILWAARDIGEPEVTEQATVVRFGAYSSDTGATPVVIVRTKDGRLLQLEVDARTTQRCRTGSDIQVLRRGSTLTGVGGCRPPPP